MLLRVFTMRDIKAQAFVRPFFVQTVAVAFRAIAESANEPNSQFGRYPHDFELWEIGEWDDIQGEIIPRHAVNHGLVAVIISSENKASDKNREPINEERDESPVLAGTIGGDTAKHVRPNSRS